jgi:hypothetical protein
VTRDERDFAEGLLLSVPVAAIAVGWGIGSAALMILGFFGFGVVLFGIDYRRLSRRVERAPYELDEENAAARMRAAGRPTHRS